MTRDDMLDCLRYNLETLEAQVDLITKIQNGIKATDADDVYMCGMRNAMRWCISLIDNKEPLYENCPPAQPEIVRCTDCRHLKKWRSEESAKKFGQIYECVKGVLRDPVPEDFCSRAERRT